MKYFTPELYIRFNSDDPDEAERAHEEWEGAIVRYREHLKKTRRKMTPSVRKLSESLCLHDAGYLGLHWLQIGEMDDAPALLALRRSNRLIVLVYFLAEEPLIEEVRMEWPFSRESVHWLYDEFDLADGEAQQHEVLLSNGRIITLRFYDLQLVEHDVHPRSSRGLAGMRK